MASIVEREVPPAARDLLDLGCGTGRLTRRIADGRPLLRVIGIDISAANIAAAESESGPSMLRFERADYLSYRGGPFDAIVSDGVLHLIPGDTGALVDKLAADLRPGGVLVCCMPFDCAYNRAFAAARRLLKRLRAPWLDRAMLAVGRAFHGGSMNDEGLRERIPYMYLPPERMMGDDLRERLAQQAGLRAGCEYAMPSVSLAQLRHNVTIFRKDPTA